MVVSPTIGNKMRAHFFLFSPADARRKKQNYDTKNIEKKHGSLLIWKLLYTFAV